MSVFKRKTSSGETQEYHYRFMKSGKLYLGVCEGCFDEKSARDYETRIRATASELATQKSVKALVENFRDELSGGEKILLKDACSVFDSKPSRREASQTHKNNRMSRFNDFVLFMSSKYPDVRYLNDVKPKHAEAYVAQIRTAGRFSKLVNTPTGNYEAKSIKLSTHTQNRYLKDIKGIFDKLAKQCGIIENPFADIQPVMERKETREPFTEKELELILSKSPAFIRDIFIVGFFTAFREGDISTLRWDEILWDKWIIRRKLMKTGVVVEIPIMPPLAKFLQEKIGNGSEYVLPEHARMYRDNPSGISYRVKRFLEEDLKIATTKKVDGRSRAVSIKDVHSLRHTFCYFAGVAGIPLVVVQSIVGHMTPEMTAHYTAHADRKTKREKLSMLPYFDSMTAETRRTNLVEQTRIRLLDIIKKADDATLNRVAAILMPAKPKKLLLRSKEPEKSIQ